MNIVSKYRDKSSPKSGFQTYQHFVTFKIKNNDHNNNPYFMVVGWNAIEKEYNRIIGILVTLNLPFQVKNRNLTEFTIRFRTKADAMLFKLNNV